MATPKKAQAGTSLKGNPKGYKTSTSPLKTGPYEKKVLTSGNVTRRVDGSGKVISSAPSGTKSAEQIKAQQSRDSSYTMNRRNINREFLESREKTGVKASTLKTGGKLAKNK